MTPPQRFVRTTGAAAAAAALLGAVGGPASSLTALVEALSPAAGPSAASSDPLAAVVPLVALGAWVLALWVGVVAVLLLAGQRRGAVGRLAHRASRAVAPVVLQRSVAVLLGVTVVVGAAPAQAHEGSRAAAPVAASSGAVAAAGEAGGSSLVSIDWPVGSSPAAAPAAPATPALAGEVVVRPGDSLWRLAERSLGEGATPARVATTWPAWWAANRDVVGADPDLILPGTRLVPPTP